MKKFTWEATVAMPSPSNGFIPTHMTGEFKNIMEATAYFTKFGKIIMGPRIIS